MKKANFFIIGAPKCGTSALSEYLGVRKDVFFSVPKEVNHFNTDFSAVYRKKWGVTLYGSEAEYTDAVFGGANDSHLAVGEGSPWYLASKVAPASIRTYNPDARIIVMLRNPVSLAPSMHSQELFERNEDVKGFERAWGLQDQRQEGKCVPARCTEPQVVQYRSACMLGSHMKRLFDVFPREQVLAIQFDRFVRQTRTVYNEVLNFLQLPADGRIDFPQVNARREHRSLLLHDFVAGDHLLARLLDRAKKAARIDSLGIKDVFYRFNVKHNQFAELSTELRLDLVRTFSDDVSLLEQLLGWDLAHWREIN